MNAPSVAPPIQKSFRPGQFLFHEGEPSRSLFLLRKGTVAVRKMKGASYVELSRIYANEVLGEMAFFNRHSRSAAAVALTDVEALEISFESLDHIYSNIPDYMRSIMAAVVERLRKANDQIRRLEKNTVNEEGEFVEPGDTQSAAEILAATAKIGTGQSEDP